MKTQHTPAPWLTIADKDEIVVYAKSGPHGDDPICFTSDSRELKEIQANARLITAAPELLEALQGCIDELELHEKMATQTGDEDLLNRLQAAREAIQKATV